MFNHSTIRKIAISSAIFLLLFSGRTNLFAQNKPTTVGNFTLSKAEDEFLEDLSKRAFQYLWEQSDPVTGLTLDRTRTDGTRLESPDDHKNIASIAASGFALTSYCIAADRNWVTRREAKDRTRHTLDFFANRAWQKNGWFYHWMDMTTGERRWQSEVSSIDTALLMAGVLTVRGCFPEDKGIVQLAAKIYNRIDFKWMLNGDEYILSHGWKPESGFLPSRWENYSENSILYLMGIGSPTHPISWQSWYAWQRGTISYGKYTYLAAVPPLFIHQYSQAWVDFRHKREHYRDFNVDYYENSVKASRAQREFCLSLTKEFPGYAGNMWGISASDSQQGYVAWGGPPREPAIDGTVVPYAPAGSLMFTPDISLPALKEMKTRFGDRIYGRYGFTDAFNPNNGWINPDVLGIDLGITLIGAENLRSGHVWQWFMRNTEMKNALTKAKIY